MRGGECFGLKVKADSMIDEGIHDGDTIIVRRQATADNGQTAVAIIDVEATFLSPLEVEVLPGIGDKTAAALRDPIDSGLFAPDFTVPASRRCWCRYSRH